MEPKKILTPVVLAIALAVGFGGGVFFQKSRSSGLALTSVINQEQGKPDGVDFAVFWDVWNLLRQNYVDTGKLTTQDMVYGSIDGLVNSTGDPYTTFFKPKESKEFAQQIKGAFGGVGIEIGLRNGILTVIAPIKDTPADRAGLQAGDKILKIDSKSTEHMNVEEAVGLIRGPTGTSVTLAVLHEPAKTPRDVKLVRDVIKIPAVAWKMIDTDTAYLQVFVFNQNVDQEFGKAAQEIAKSPARRMILDLRNNPGGLLDSAVDLAGYFFDTNTVVTIQRDGKGAETVYRTARNGLLKNYPLVVLINKGSASASEILAGALRDNRNVLLVGETSFGKGSVQDIFQLPGNASLKITFAKWFTPNGTSINENGIKPTIEVKRTDDDFQNDRDPQLDKAKELIKTL